MDGKVLWIGGDGFADFEEGVVGDGGGEVGEDFGG